MKKIFPLVVPFILLFIISLACSRETNFANVTPVGTQFATPTFIYDDPSLTARAPTPRFTLTPLPPLAPGETLIYRVQTDDTLQRIAQRFNVPLNDLLTLNKMNADEPLALDQILLVPARIGQTGPSFKIVPDSELVYSLGVAGFNPTEFIAKRGGYLAKYKEFAEGSMRNGGEIIQVVALNHSISPRILLAVLEYQTGWVTNPATPEDLKYPLGIRDPLKQGLYKQLDAFADQLNLGYYSWRYGSITVIDLVDGTQQRIHPTLNAGTVSLHYALSRRYKLDEWNKAMGQDGVYATFNKLFGNPFERAIDPLVPEGLTQPDLALPFVKDVEWLFISGPHAAWLPGSPWAALDFAPPANVGGCFKSDQWVTAPTSGLIVRAENGVVMLDLDGDGREQSGWVIMFLHIGEEGRIKVGKTVEPGDLIGHPSCEGGRSTGTHFHIARKFNGEWIPADSRIPFVLGGWRAHFGQREYRGTLTKGRDTITACECSSEVSGISSKR